MRYLSIFLVMIITAVACRGKAKSKIPDSNTQCASLQVSDTELQNEMADFAQEFNIIVTINKQACAENSVYECDAVSDDDHAYIYDFLKKTREEFRIYPTNFLRNTANLHELAFGKNLRGKEQDSIAGLTITDGTNSAMNINTDAIRSCSADSYRRITQHEMGHVLDNLGPNGQPFSARLSSMNPSNFTYGSKTPENVDFFRMNHPEQGFVSYYATSSQQEDFAEMYALHFAKFPESTFKKWIQEDPFLKAKLLYVSDSITNMDSELTSKLPNYQVLRKLVK